ncbi:hypothetical protein FDZ71_15325, partial [bacterium]
WMAAHLFCGGENKPCGNCPGCVRLETDNHPDIMILKPEDGSIKNQQVEAFQEFLRIKPFLAAAKVGIIEDADTMTPSAQNRLLKTLEEPAPGTTLFLITTNFNRMLTTIMSRCQTLRFQGLDESGIASYLMNHYNVDRIRAEHLGLLSGGSLARALAQMDSVAVEESEELVGEWLAALAQGDRVRMFELADRYEKTIDWDQTLVWLMRALRERMFAAVGQGKPTDTRTAVRMGRHVEDALKALREQANERIVIDVMLLKMQEDYYG